MTDALAFRDLTTLRVGGAIDNVRTPANRAELIDSYRELSTGRRDFFVIGGGSNIVPGEQPFDGTVLRVTTRGIERHNDGGRVLVTAQAGEPWDALVEWTVANGLAGIEALSGIPGTVGAAPIQNIGAYGAELDDVFESLVFVPAGGAELRTLHRDDLRFGYRTSVIKEGLAGLVVSVTLALIESPASTPIRYAQLASALAVEVGDVAPLADVRRAVLALRESKGMVLGDDPDSVSAGSFFTNPIVSGEVARTLPVDAPRYPTTPEPAPIIVPLGAEPVFPDRPESPGEIKLSAAWLIERAGIARGFSLPGSNAAVSSKHTLAIVNRGGATADEVIELARYISIRVHDTFGIMLTPEPTFVNVE